MRERKTASAIGDLPIEELVGGQRKSRDTRGGRTGVDIRSGTHIYSPSRQTRQILLEVRDRPL